MKIHIAKGAGGGPTELSAFDSALNVVGVENYNLIKLSSVIPPASEIIEYSGRIDVSLGGKWGDRLYVVMAECHSSRVGIEAWAGIGWVIDEDQKGLFVEHEGHSEQEVRWSIQESLTQLMKTRNMEQLEIHMSVAGVECKNEPVCALAVAVYQHEKW